MGKQWHVCTDCGTPHIDNCPRCFGFGLLLPNCMPIAAAEAADDSVPWDDVSVACWECGSTWRGVKVTR